MIAGSDSGIGHRNTASQTSRTATVRCSIESEFLASTRKYERNSPKRPSISPVTFASGIFFYEKLSPSGKHVPVNGIYNDPA